MLASRLLDSTGGLIVYTFVKAVIVVTIVASGVTASNGEQGAAVKWAGALRNVMQGDLSGQLTLKTLSGLPHLYAVGVIEQLQGEVSIFDGVPSIAQMKEGRITIDKSFNSSAAFVVYAQVERNVNLSLSITWPVIISSA